jgi:hypothetical protein
LLSDPSYDVFKVTNRTIGYAWWCDVFVLRGVLRVFAAWRIALVDPRGTSTLMKADAAVRS